MPKQLEIEVVESLVELYSLQNKQPNRSLINRVQMLILLKKGNIKYHTELEESLPFNIRTIKDWMKMYRQGGLSQLLSFNQGGNRSAAIQGEVYDKLGAVLKDPNNQICSYQELQQYVAGLGVEIKYKALYKFVREHFKVKLKVGRKSNIKKDDAAVAVFKNRSGAHKTN